MAGMKKGLMQALAAMAAMEAMVSLPSEGKLITDGTGSRMRKHTQRIPLTKKQKLWRRRNKLASRSRKINRRYSN